MVFTNDGSYQYSIGIQCLYDLVQVKEGQILTIPNMPLSTVEWYPGAKSSEALNQASLIIAYQCGRFQLMKSETDNMPSNIDSGIQINEVKWNPRGDVFAISGALSEGDTVSGVIQFYDAFGSYIRVIKIDKADFVGPLTWNGAGLKLALGIGSSMFIAACKLNYKKCYLPTAKSLVFAIEKENRIDNCMVFYDTQRKTYRSKFVRFLLHLVGFEDYCCIISRVEETPSISRIMLCTANGAPTETKFINFEPVYVIMNRNYIIISSHEHVYVWQYRALSGKSALESEVKKATKELAFAFDQNPDPKKIYNYQSYEVDESPEHQETLSEYVATVCCTHDSFYVVTSSGRAKRIMLPHMNVESELSFADKPNNVYPNKDSSRLAVINGENVLSFYTKEADKDPEKVEYEKKEVWAFMWARDSPTQCCYIDKYRLHVMIDWVVTHLINIDSYLGDFYEMKIMTVDIETIVNRFDSDHPEAISKCFFEVEIPSLVSIKKLLSEREYDQAFTEIDGYKQGYLWEIAAEQALLNMDFDRAEMAFVENNNYAGLKFCQRLQSMENKLLQKAEIYGFFKKYEESRETLLRAERKDLAVNLMTKIGDYQGLEQAISKGDWDQALLNKSYRILANYYKDCLNWKKAGHYFNLCDEQDEIIDCHFMNKNTTELSDLVVQVSDPEILVNIGEKLEALNCIESAAKAYEKSGDPKRGIDTCIVNNYWGAGVELAERNNLPQIDSLITKYAKVLLEKNRKLEAIELFRKANRNPEAASMLNTLAKELIDRNLSPLLIKKLFVLAGMEVTNYQKRLTDATLTGGATTQRTLDTLITSDINTGVDKALTNPWVDF